MQAAKTIELSMKSGEILTLEMSDILIAQIRDAFSLASINDVTEQHVKRYLVSAMRKTLEVRDDQCG